MGKTGLGDYLHRLRLAQETQAATGIRADEIQERWAAQSREANELVQEARSFSRTIDRRAFLLKASKAGGLLAGSAALASLAACSKPATPRPTPPAPQTGSEMPRPGSNQPRIAVVGAGLAGLTAAYRLSQAGHPVTVYEGNDRVGGRAHTLRDFFDDGNTVELCGEYINSDHTSIRKMADELGLTQTNLWSSYPSGSYGLYWFDGKPYLHTDANAAFDQIYPALIRDKNAAGYPTTYNSSTKRGRELDNMTLAEWLDREVDGGLNSTFGRFVDVGYTGEYGLDVQDQSALNLMFEAGFSKPGDHRLYGYQDWKWRIEGGNDLVATGMADALPQGSIVMESPLVAVRGNDDGTTTLTFQPGGGGTVDANVDIAIMALPFTKLRAVDLSQSGWSDLKLQSVANMGMATNSKLHLQFTSPVWHKHHISGDIQTDKPLEEMTVVYPIEGDTGILDNYKGGTDGASYPVSEPFSAVGEDIAGPALDALEKIVPGARAAWNGKAYLSNLAANPWSAGSYSCPRPGEYSTIFGAARLPEGQVLFAGEHTVWNFGFLNAGVESGERAAKEAKALLGT